MKVKSLIVLVGLVLFFGACQKEVMVDSGTENESSDQKRSEVLEFNSIQGFQELVSEMKNENMEKYEAIKENRDFLSLEESNKMLLKNTSEGDENVEADPEDSIVYDPFLVKLLDEKRSIIIDGYYYRITSKGMFRCFKERKSQLDDYLNNNLDALSIDNIEKDNSFLEVAEGIELFLPKEIFEGSLDDIEINSGLKSSNLDYARMNECDEGSKTKVGDLIGGVVGYSVNCENNYSSRKRVKSVFWAQNWFFYSSVGIKVKMQKRRLGIWWAEKAQNLELGWDVIEYKVKYDLNPKYYTLSIDENILQTKFHDLAHFDKIKEIIKNFKIKNGRYPNAMMMHRELCRQNYKEWTVRDIKYYDNTYADLVWYLKNGDYDRVRNKVRGLSSKAILNWLKSELKSSWDPSETNTFDDWNRLPENKIMTLINENMEVTRIVLPQEGAMKAVNENKMEKILDYSEGVFSFGYSNKGGTSFFDVRVYKAPTTYKIQNGSSIYGLARYDNQWRGSRIVKR